MEVDRPPTVSVVVVADHGEAQLIDTLLRDDNTTVVRWHWPSDPTDGAARWDRPDVVIFGGAAADQTPRRIRYLRHRWPTIFIVAVNTHDDADSMRLFDAGADQVIERGSLLFDTLLRAIIRRARAENAGARIAVGDIVFDRESRRVWCAGCEVQMTPREFAMLDCMFWNAPRPVGAITLADFVWGDAEGEAEARRGVVEVYIGYLRRKLSASRSVMIRTVRGVGYRFDPRN